VCVRGCVHQPPTAHRQAATAAGMCGGGLVCGCVCLCVRACMCISLPLLTASLLQQQVCVRVGLYVCMCVWVWVCASASHCSQPVRYSSRYLCGWACMWVWVCVCVCVCVHQPPTAHSQSATAAGMFRGRVCMRAYVGVWQPPQCPLPICRSSRYVWVWVCVCVAVSCYT
jgi:hypothetical protein